MKEQADLVRGLLRKARSDLCAMDASFQAGAFDASCFHAQQAVEKYLKTYLTHAEIPFPFSHNLAKLLHLCMAAEPSFGELVDLVTPLTPYAVELRYDVEFWPTKETADTARSSAWAVREFILRRLPSGIAESDR